MKRSMPQLGDMVRVNSSCDAGGLPLFEEALFAGIAAAEHSLDTLDTTYTTSLHGMPVHG